MPDEEICTRMDISPADLNKLRAIPKAEISTNKALGSETETELQDMFGVDDRGYAAVEDSFVTEELHQAIGQSLTPRELRGVVLRYGLLDGERRSYREVGDELGVTAEAARRLVKRASETLKEHLKTRIDLDDFR